MINIGSINWGKVVESGFGILKEKISEASGPPSNYGGDWTTTTSSGGGNMPAWVVPVAIIAGVLLLFGKKIKRLFK